MLSVLEDILAIWVALHEVGEDLATNGDILGKIDYEPPHKCILIALQSERIPSLRESSSITWKEGDEFVDHPYVDLWFLHGLDMIHILLVPILNLLIVTLILYGRKDLLSS